MVLLHSVFTELDEVRYVACAQGSRVTSCSPQPAACDSDQSGDTRPLASSYGPYR